MLSSFVLPVGAGSGGCHLKAGKFLQNGRLGIVDMLCHAKSNLFFVACRKRLKNEQMLLIAFDKAPLDPRMVENAGAKSASHRPC